MGRTAGRFRVAPLKTRIVAPRPLPGEVAPGLCSLPGRAEVCLCSGGRRQAGRGGGHVRSKPSRVLLYDKQPGGPGISSQVRPIFGDLLEAARDLIKGCETR